MYNIYISPFFYIHLSLSTSSFFACLTLWMYEVTYLKQKRTINKINHVHAKTQYAESRNKEYIFMDTACVVYHQRYIFFACISNDLQVHSSEIYEYTHELYLENNSKFVLAAYTSFFKHFVKVNLKTTCQKVVVSTSKRHQDVSNLFVFYLIFNRIHGHMQCCPRLQLTL